MKYCFQQKYISKVLNLISIFYIFDGLFKEMYFSKENNKKIFTINQATAHLITYFKYY